MEHSHNTILLRNKKEKMLMHAWISKTLNGAKEVRYKRVYTIGFHLSEVLKSAKIIYRDKNPSGGGLGKV
jgi:ribosomal protein L17